MTNEEKRAKRLEVLQKGFMGPEALVAATRLVDAWLEEIRKRPLDVPLEDDYKELTENFAFLLMLTSDAGRMAVEIVGAMGAMMGEVAGARKAMNDLSQPNNN